MTMLCVFVVGTLENKDWWSDACGFLDILKPPLMKNWSPWLGGMAKGRVRMLIVEVERVVHPSASVAN